MLSYRFRKSFRELAIEEIEKRVSWPKISHILSELSTVVSNEINSVG